MAARIANFAISGPRHLVNPDWSNPTHRRSIAASLVHAVYVLEKDHRLGPPWWKFFNFHPSELLVDQTDDSIFAAIFENPNAAAQTDAPAAVVAFRGTVFKRHTLCTDSKLNLKLITNGLHQTPRFEDGLRAVKSRIDRHGQGNVWLAGHSLGAAFARAVGREICETEGYGLESHLFNPPFPFSPLERINNPNLKLGVQLAHNLLVTGLAVAFKSDAHDAFDGLRRWCPNLYVNPRDNICSGYVGYFENRKCMQDLGLGVIADISARHCLEEYMIWALGKDSKASHLMPSATLTVNLNPSSEFRKAHGIRQWWSPHLQFRCTRFSLGRNDVSSVRYLSREQ